MRLIGEAQQQWAPLRRKYNLFLHRPEPADEHLGAPQLTSGDLPLSNSTALEPISPEAEAERSRPGILSQFAYVNEPFLSWDFTLMSADNRVIGSVNRNFAGLAREVFTDTGVYALRMDSESLATEPNHLISRTAQRGLETPHRATGMTLDQRAVMLATAVSVDFDYFSRHSHSGGGWFFPWFYMGGDTAGGAAAGGAAGGAAEAGAAEAGAVGARSATEAATRGAGGMMGAGEGAMVGAGTLAGYEAMQRAAGRNTQANDPDEKPTQDTDDDWGWGGDQGGSGGSSGGSTGSGTGGTGGGGDGGGSFLDDFF